MREPGEQGVVAGAMRDFTISLGLRAACFAASVCLPGIAAAQTKAAPKTYRQEALPLGEALERFGRAAAFDIVFPEHLVRGRRSGPVDSPNPYRALEQILIGTGLAARFTRPDAIILELVRAPSKPALTLDTLDVGVPDRDTQAAYQWYGQKLLESSLALLRSSRALAVKSYDLTVYLWVDKDGGITASRVYAASGAADEADIAAGALATLAMRLPPPANMPQPVGLRIASY